MTQGVPGVRPVTLNGRVYIVDPKRCSRRTLPMLRTASDTSGETGETSLTTEGPWRRSSSNWQGGAGQLRRDEGGDPSRFYKSKGVNPWTLGKATLHKTTYHNYSSTTGPNVMTACGDFMAFADVGALFYATNGTENAMSGESGNAITGMCFDGKYLYVADGTDVRRWSDPTAGPAATWAITMDLVWYANGRLLGADGNKLYEISSAGAATLLYTHPNPNFAWSSAAGAPNGIYLTGHGGLGTGAVTGVSEVYYLGIDTTTGALTVPIVATPWPVTELIYKIAYHGRWMFFCTKRGIRLGEITGDNHITYGSAIEVPGLSNVASGDGVRDVTFIGEFAYFTWTAYDGTSSGLGRIFLGYFTDPDNIVPAYATDLMATTQAVVTSVVAFQFTGATHPFIAFGCKGTAGGVYMEHETDYVTSATLDTGWITYDTIEKKMPYQATVAHEPLVGSIAVSFISPAEATTALGTSSTATSLEPAAGYAMPTTLVERFRLLLTLTRGSATTVPVLTRWLAKALPAATQTEEIILAILMADSVLSPGEGAGEGDGFAYVPKEEWDALKVLESTKVPFTAQIGDESLTVRLDTMGLEPDRWSEGNKFLAGLIMTRLLTL